MNIFLKQFVLIPRQNQAKTITDCYGYTPIPTLSQEISIMVLTYLAGKDREIRSHDGDRFPCLRTWV